jgi:hypothetical protein
LKDGVTAPVIPVVAFANSEPITKIVTVSEFVNAGAVLNNALSYLLSVKVVLSAAIADT